MAGPIDIGESLVGAYLRYGELCDFVVCGTQTEGQGEIDVIGFQVERQRVWLCEVATHLDGLQYRSAAAGGTVAKVRQKVACAVAFGDRMFPGQEKRFEWWSPKAGPRLHSQFEAIGEELSSAETEVHFIVNAEYAARVRVLFERAKKGTKATPESFFRTLQILAHLAGSPLRWDNPTDGDPT
jgi:hypothetical protein